MTVEELKTRIQKKEEQIAKLERLYNRYSSEDLEEKAIIDRFLESGDRNEYRAYLKLKGSYYGGDAWSKANELYDARNTLNNYKKQLTATQDKENTLTDLPEVVKEFANNLYERWNRYDIYKRDECKKEYFKLMEEDVPGRERHVQMQQHWGMNYRELWYMSDKDIQKANKTAVNNLILNMVNRTIELTGKITDCQYLHLDQDNQGYTILNGLVIGEKGKARIESIGAGGYNIQRYHIRVLVKEAK